MTAGLVLSWQLPAARAETTCLAHVEQRDAWHRVPLPAIPNFTSGPRVSVRFVVQNDANPCQLLAADLNTVYRSLDGGLTWSRKVQFFQELSGMYAEGLGPNTVVFSFGGRGAPRITRDFLRQMPERIGLSLPGTELASVAQSSTYDVVGAAADPQRPDTLYFAVRHEIPQLPVENVPTPSLYRSDDGGATTTPVLGSVGLVPNLVAVDPGSGAFWIDNDPEAESAYNRVNRPTLLRGDGTSPVLAPKLYDDRVRDVALGRRSDGTPVLYVATDAPLRVSHDEGETFRTAPGLGRPFPELALEATDPDVVMAATGSSVVRRSPSHPALAATDGLPPDCQPTDLVRDAGSPSTFLVRCGQDAYRFRSSGVDIVTTSPGDPPPLFGLPRLMEPLAVVPLAPPDATTIPGHGAIAFDGRLLYYTIATGPQTIAVRRMTPAGVNAGELVLPPGAGADFLTFDFRRRELVTWGGPNGGTAIDPLTGRWRRVPRPKVLGLKSISHDFRTDTYLATNHVDRVYRFARNGDLVQTCRLDPNISAVMASGDGDGYVQMEDDQTVRRIRMDTCEVSAEYVHRAYSEAQSEDDQMACDGVTFGRPAMWIRDSLPNLVSAYAIPNGYCPVPTRLALTNARSVHVDRSTPVCVRLTDVGGVPIRGATVGLTVDGRTLGDVVTDDAGRGCRRYAPRALADPRGPVDGDGKLAVAAGVRPILGVFTGRGDYLPSQARSTIDVVVPVPDVVPPREPERPPRGLAAVGHLPPYPRLPVAARPAPEPQAQPFNQPQPNPGPQAQAQSQPLTVGVTVPQRQQQAVTVGVAQEQRELAMSRWHPRRRRGVPSPLGPAVGLAMVGVAALAHVTARAHRRID